MTYVVQSVQLSRDKYSKDEAFAWIRKHGYKASKVDATPNYFRFRQMDPALLRFGRFRTVELGDDGYLTIYYMGKQQ
jgi:hypothetical protein